MLIPACCIGSVILFAVLFLIFSQGIGTGYVFDDITSVVPLHRLREQPEHFLPLVFSDVSGPLGRPISIASFAAEQVFLGGGPDQSQAISICLHGINAALVFFVVWQMLRFADVSKALILAFFVAVVWAANPQKVSSVLYIVQRMTLLATTFMLLAVSMYLSARGSVTSAAKVIRFAFSALFAFLAPFAKENGVLVFPVIAAVELFLISGRGGPKAEDGQLRALSQLVLILGLGVFFVLGLRTFIHAESAYAIRSFDFWDRILFTPVALMDYAKQFLLPNTAVMGLLHDDVSVSVSAIRFWPAAILMIGATLLFLHCMLRGTASFFALGLSIFLIGHCLETTFLPLELYFEHRNYFPSLGLAVCLAAALHYLASNIWRDYSRLLLGGAVAYSAALVLSTSIYAQHWSSYAALLAHELNGHPDSARANTEYALAVAESGHYDLAVDHIDKAIILSRSYKAARILGEVDGIALKVAAACLSGQPLAAELPDDLLRHDHDRVHSRVFAMLANMVRDQACPDGDWSAISDWAFSHVSAVSNAGGRVHWSALRDLAFFEREVGNFTRAYVYASMASESNPNDGTLMRLKLEAALAANDAALIRQLVEEFERMQRDGKLRPVDTIFLEKLRSIAEFP